MIRVKCNDTYKNTHLQVSNRSKRVDGTASVAQARRGSRHVRFLAQRRRRGCGRGRGRICARRHGAAVERATRGALLHRAHARAQRSAGNHGFVRNEQRERTLDCRYRGVRRGAGARGDGAKLRAPVALNARRRVFGGRRSGRRD
jgi:hypothetical protein